MAKRSGYLQRLRAQDEARDLATRQTFQQYMLDMLTLALNDPEIMGKDTFGYEPSEAGAAGLGEEVRPVL